MEWENPDTKTSAKETPSYTSMRLSSERTTDGEKKRRLERSPSSGSVRQAAQEAGVTKATAACSGPRHLKHAWCPPPGTREAGQETP